jgi:hypothetical protein
MHRVPNGQFWYGPMGFLYKAFPRSAAMKKSTKMGPGGNNTGGNIGLYNKYTPNSNGVGACSISNRRAKNRLASVSPCCKCTLNTG